MIEPNYVSVLDFKVYSDDLNHIPIHSEQTRVINTISPNSYGISLKDEEFKQSLINTDFLVLDGVYFAIASILLKGKNIKRNQGPDVFDHFITRINTKGGKVFFLGSSVKTLNLIERRIKAEYKKINVATFSPPFKETFTNNDNKEMIAAINAFKPDIVFVGMTCPKQEKWSIAHKNTLDTRLIISIGNVFDWFAGTQKNIHPLWYKMRLAWLVRVFYRPEIFRRNIKNQLKFFSDIIKIFFLKFK